MNCIFTVASTDYLTLALSLYKSFRLYDKKNFFEIYLVNVDTNNDFSKIQDEKLIVNYINYEEDDLRYYCSILRIKIFPKLLEKKYELIYWCDADMLIRCNLFKKYEFYGELKDNKTDLVITGRKINKINTSIVGICNNDKMKNFISDWNKKLNSIKQKWFADQNSIQKLINSDSCNIRVKLLSYRFFDCRKLRDNSFVWNVKGKRKHNLNNKFLEYQKKVLNT